MAERRYGRGMNWGNSFKAPRAPLLRRHGEFGQRRVPYSRDSLELRQQNNDNRSVNRNDVSHTSVSKPGCFTAEIHFSYNAKQASCSSSLSCDVAKRISVNKSYAKIRPVATNISDRGNKSSRTSKAVIDTDYDKRGRIKHQQQDRVKSEGKHSGSGRSSSIPQNIEVTNKPDDETSTAVADKPMEDDILYILADDNRFDEESDRLLGSGTVSSTSVDDVKLCSKEKECVVDDYKTNLDEPFQIHAEPADSLCGDDSNTHCPNVNNKGQSRSRDNHSDRIGDYNKPTKTKVEQVENNGKSITREMLSRSRSRMESCRLHDSGWPSKVLSRRTDANRSSRSVNDLKECKVISKRLTQFKPPFRNIHENRNNIMRRARNRFQHKDESDMYKNQACISPRRDKTYRTESKSHEDKSHFPSKSKDYNRRHFHYDQGYASNRNRGTYVPSGGDRLRQTSTQQFDEINYSSRKSEIDGTRSGTKSEKTIYITDGKTHSIDRYSQPPIQESNDHTTGDSANPAYMYTEQYNSNSYGRSFNENNSSVRSKVKHNHGFSSRMQNNDSRFTFKRHNITTSVGLRHYDRVRKKYFWGNCSKNTSRFQRPSTNKTRLMKSNNTDATSKTKTEAESKHESVREGTNCDFVSQSSPTSAVDETPQIEIPLVTHDPNEQLVFMPNLELQNSNMHIMDQFGNIVNPESVTPMGCNQPMPMQLDSSAVPIPFPGTDYVFIPFVDQVPNIPLNQGISWTNNLNEPTSNTDFISPMEQMYMMQQSMTFDMLGLQQADEGNLDKQIWCTNTGSEIDQNKSYSKTAVEKSDDCQSEEAGVNVQKYEVVGNMDDVGNTEEVKTNTNADRKHTFRKKGQPRTTKRGQYNPGQHGRHAVGTNEQNSDKRILKIKRDVEQEVSDIRKVVESSEGQFIQKKIRPIDILPTESKSINDNSTRSTSIFSRLAPGTSDKHKLLHEQRAISPLHITFQNDNYAKQEAGNKKIHINSKIQKDENPEQNMAQAHNDDISNKLFVHHKLQSADQSKNATVGNDKHTNNADQAQEREKRSVDGNKKIDSLHDKIDFVEKERQKETNVIDCHRKKSNTFIQHDQTYSKKDKGNKEVDKEYALENMRYHRQQSKYKTKPNDDGRDVDRHDINSNADKHDITTDQQRTSYMHDNNSIKGKDTCGDELSPTKDTDKQNDRYSNETEHTSCSIHYGGKYNNNMNRHSHNRQKSDNDRKSTTCREGRTCKINTVKGMVRNGKNRENRNDVDRTRTQYSTDRKHGVNRDWEISVHQEDESGTNARNIEPDINTAGELGSHNGDREHKYIDRTSTQYRGNRQPDGNTAMQVNRDKRVKKCIDRTGTIYEEDREHASNIEIERYIDEDVQRDYNRTGTRYRDGIKMNRPRVDQVTQFNERTGTIHKEVRESANNIVGEMGKYSDGREKMDDDRTGTGNRNGRQSETYNASEMNKPRDDRVYADYNRSKTRSRDDRQHEDNSTNDMMQMDISVDDRMNRDKDRAMTVHMINGHPEHSTVNEMNTPWSHRGKRDLYETETLYRTDIPYGDNDKSPALYRDDRRYDDNFTCGIGKDGEDHWHYVKDKTMIRYRDDTEPEHTTVGGIDRQYSDNNRTGSRDRDDRKHDGNTTSKKHTDGDRKKDNDLSFTRHRDNRADRRNNSNERTGTTYTEQQLDGNNSMERIIRGEYQRNNKHERMGTMYMDDRERETDGYNSVGRNKHREDRRHKHEGIETITMEDREPESVVASERDRQHKGNSGNINDKTRTWCMDDDTSGEMDQTKYGRWNKDKYRSGIRCKDNRSRDHSGESVHDRDRHGYMRKNNDSERTRYIESSQPSTKIDSHDGKEMKSVTRMRTRYSNDRQPIDNNAGDIGTHRDGRGGTYSNKTETSYKDNTQCEHNQQDIEVRHNASERRNNDHITDQVSKSNSEMFNANDNNITKIEYNQKDIAKADKQEDGKQFDTMDYSYRRANIKMSKQVKSARIQKAEEPVQTLHGHTSQLNAVDISTALTATSQLLHKVSESNAMHIEPSLPSLNVCTLETNIAPALALQTSEGNVPPVNALQQPGCVVQQPVPGQIHHLDIGNIVSQPFQQAPVMQQLQQQILMEQAMQSQLPNQQLLNIASMNQQLQLQNLVSQMQTQDHNSGTGIQQLVVQQPNQQQKFQQFQPPQLPTTHPLLNQPTENALQQRMVQHGSIVQQQSLMDNEVLLSINQLQQVQQMLRTPSAISDQSQQAAMQPKVIGTLMARPTDGIGSGVPGLNQHRIYNSSHTGNGQNTPPSYQQTPGLIVMPNMSATVQEARGGRLVQLSSGSQQSTSNTARPSVVSGIPRSQSDVTSTAGRIGIKMGINAKSSQNKSNDDKRGILCSRCNMQFSNSKIYKKHVQWHEYYSKHFKQ